MARSRRPPDLRVGDLRVVAEFPPNYADILTAIPAVAGMEPVFAWGDVIFNPHGVPVDGHLHAHESLHGLVQHPAVGGPQQWWDRYLSDPDFRLGQEVEAYRLQLRSFAAAARASRELRHRYALVLAGQLSSPLYGLGATRIECYRRIAA